MISTIWLHLK